MKKLGLVALLALVAAPSFASSPFAGKWEPQMPAPAAYQSLTSADQALGFQAHLASLNYKGQPLLTLAWQASVVKHFASDPTSPAKFYSGPVFAVPGSLLDWALGTTWGQQWLPKAKTGFTAAPDVTRLNAIGPKNTFFGFGISYPIGG